MGEEAKSWTPYNILDVRLCARGEESLDHQLVAATSTLHQGHPSILVGEGKDERQGGS